MILITGGTGFLGLHLLIQLTEKCCTPIKAIYRSEKKLNSAKKEFLRINTKPDAAVKWNQINWIKANINDIPSLENAFKNCTEVYHCAAMVSFKKNDFNRLKKINIEGTANLVNLSLVFNIKKFCYVSSVATLNLNPGESVYTEDSQWNNEAYNSGYAISKHGGEMEVWRGIQEGLNAVIVNPGVILDTGFYTKSSSKIFNEVKKGFHFYTNGSTGFVSAKDCVIIMMELMDLQKFNERFIIIAENISYKELIDKIAVEIKAKAPSKLISKKWLFFLSKVEYYLCAIFGINPKIPLEVVNSLTTNSTYSNQKITDTLKPNFEPIHKVIENVAKDFNLLHLQE